MGQSTEASRRKGWVTANAPSLAAAGVLLGLIVFSRGGAAALLPMFKLLLPVILALVLIHLIKRRFAGGLSAVLRQQAEKMMAQQQGRAGAPGGGKVLDLCPKCGAYVAPGHRCR